jgi:glycine cleavage system aminomethyltransferase T
VYGLVTWFGAAERLLARYGVSVGSSAVLFGNHDRLYVTAHRLAAAGLGIAAIVDTREEQMLTGRPALAHLRAQLRNSGTECLAAHAVVASEGGLEVKGAVVATANRHGARRRIPCDAILVSGGWSPSVHASLHEGGARLFDGQTASFIAGSQPGWRTTIGAANGTLDLATVISDAYVAGEHAARASGARGSAGQPPRARADPPPALLPYWRSPALEAEEKRQFVDFQNDVTVADLRQAVGEGFTHIEHLKRYTTLNFGTEQGRTGGVVAAAIVAELTGLDLPKVGASRTRPPYHPVTLASIIGHRAGLQLRVTRRTPLHEWNESNGGVLEHAGDWMRARYYRQNGTDAFNSGIVEAKRVRSHGGILDSSTLGKIEVAGRDAGAFLDRMYLAKASTIKVGRSKYMVNLREDGFVLDDGLVLRLADDRFIATTSSEHADRILSHFEHCRDVEWSGREVAIANVTEAWAVIVVAGPASRASLSKVLGPPWDEAPAQLAHMQFTIGRWRESELRVLRASFSGELAFELHCRPASALPLWQALIAAGLPPYGLEALDILRVEKGYLTSSELNGQTTPFDLGLDVYVRLGNPCLGRELLDRSAFQDAQRPRLVGLRAADGKAKIQGGAQITTADAPARSIGHVTSSVYSPTLGEWIALGFVARSVGEGAVLLARDPLRGGDAAVRVTSPVHFDSAGERMKS